jgi:peptidoglycan/xylan/chitin deacetylase (PgdA/CDA1 family)
LLDSLDLKKVKATFHLVPQLLSNSGSLNAAKEIMKRGHLVGYRAPKTLLNMTNADIVATVNTDLDLMKTLIGCRPKYVRLDYPPNSNVKSVVEGMGLIVTTHSFDIYDYDNYSSKITDEIKADSKSFSYSILYHDIINTALHDVPSHIDKIAGKGYRFVTQDECFTGQTGTQTTSEASDQTTMAAGGGNGNLNPSNSGDRTAWSLLTVGIAAVFGIAFHFI